MQKTRENMGRLTLELRAGGSPCASTRNYNKLVNKPTVNGIELAGILSLEDLHIVSEKTESEWGDMPDYCPAVGEICYYTDTTRIKVGDGETAISDLPYLSAEFNTMRDDGDGLFVSSLNL